MPDSLLIKPAKGADEFGIVTSIDLKAAGWRHLSAMSMGRFRRGQTLPDHLPGAEVILVILSGSVSVKSDTGSWQDIGRRTHVFDGMPHALYLPKGTQWQLEAVSDEAEVAMCWAHTQEEREPCLITPASSKIEIRGGGHATRQINSIVPPGVAASKLVSVEVYTPGGNWSSYPPHKHDAHKSKGDEVMEAELEELYFYKFRQKEGFAFQRVYTADGTLDETLTPRNNDIVLVPRGYHPVSAAPGYDCYYLNFLAGSSQSLACSDDPDHSWVKQTWTDKDPRLPLVSHAMEERQSASLASRKTR